MIIVNLKGGLGNQMFQYALGRKLELKYNIPMYLDVTLLNRRDFGGNFTYRNYDLGMFNTAAKILQERCRIDRMIPEPALTYSHEVSNLFDFLPPATNVFIDGYWQCDKYFKDYEDQLRGEFTFNNLVNEGKEKQLMDEIQGSESVMINIRRTDYLKTDFHGVMGVDYIESCVGYISQHVSQPKFFIFSDDIEWCRNELKIESSFLVDHSFAGNSFATYLQLMTACKHFIIPNSTFAWWAAWLATYKEKIVIAPKKWFAKDTPTDIIYDAMNWIRL